MTKKITLKLQCRQDNEAWSTVRTIECLRSERKEVQAELDAQRLGWVYSGQFGGHAWRIVDETEEAKKEQRTAIGFGFTYYGGKATTYSALQHEGKGRARVYGNRSDGYYLVFEFNDDSLITISERRHRRVCDAVYWARQQRLGCEIPNRTYRNW